jgi:hypothetical protein
MMDAMRAIWRERGHEVDVVRGVDGPIQTDIVFLHVDCTLLPQKYLHALAGHPRVVNRLAVDLSKASFSRNIVRSPDEWEGPVIVKTVRNNGGHPERRLDRTTLLGCLRDRYWRLGENSLARARWLDPADYPIFQSARDVPPGAWRNPALFVERFLPERRGELYVYRQYKFLGDRCVSRVVTTTHPMGKRGVVIAREVPPVPEALLEARARLGFEYGKFDYVLHDGKPVLLDVNHTTAATMGAEVVLPQAQTLAPGIERSCGEWSSIPRPAGGYGLPGR